MLPAKISNWFWRNEPGLFLVGAACAAQLVFILLSCRDVWDCGIKAFTFAAGLALAAFFLQWRGRQTARFNNEIRIENNGLVINATQIPFELIREVVGSTYLALPTRIRLILNDGRSMRVSSSEIAANQLVAACESRGIP